MAIRGLFLNVLVSLLWLRENRVGAGPAHRDRDVELVTRDRARLEVRFTEEKAFAF